MSIFLGWRSWLGCSNVWPMTKNEILSSLKSDHVRLRGLVGSLTSEQKREVIFGGWTVKEILAHVAAWNKEEMKAMDDVRSGNIPWYGKADFTDEVGDKFNVRVV